VHTVALREGEVTDLIGEAYRFLCVHEY